MRGLSPACHWRSATVFSSTARGRKPNAVMPGIAASCGVFMGSPPANLGALIFVCTVNVCIVAIVLLPDFGSATRRVAVKTANMGNPALVYAGNGADRVIVGELAGSDRRAAARAFASVFDHDSSHRWFAVSSAISAHIRTPILRPLCRSVADCGTMTGIRRISL